MRKVVEKGFWKKEWAVYKQSFSDRKLLLNSFFYDLATVGAFGILLLLFNLLVQNQMQKVMQGRSAYEVQQLFLTAAPEELTVLLGDMRLLLFILSVGLPLMVLLGFFTLAFSRSHLWAYLLGKKWQKKGLGKWFLFMVLGSVLVLIYFVLGLLVKLFLVSALASVVGNPQATGVILFDSFLMQIIVIKSMMFFFALNYSFAKSSLVWKSVGDSFSLLFKKWGQLFFPVLALVLTLTALHSLLSYLFLEIFFAQQVVFFIVQPVVLLFVIAFARVYFLQVFRQK